MSASLFLLFNLCTVAYAVIGFDCGGRHMNISTVSLLEPGDCEIKLQKPNQTEVYIQLLQLSDYNYANVIQCKVEISRTLYYCGMHSHVSVVHNGRADYLEETGYNRCTRLFQDGTISLGRTAYISGIKPNATTTRSVTLAGTIGTDGSCKGAQYSDPYGTWDNVVVQASARITIKSSYVPIHLNSGKVMLKSGTTCTLSEGFCIDSDDGYTYWKPVPTSNCDFAQYDVLYEGIASRITEDTTRPHSPIVYSLTTHDIMFALTKVKEQTLCGYTLIHTEHPKLFVVETTKGDAIPSKGPVPINNLDIFAYVNSKFVYVEKHIKKQMTTLYYDVIQQKCELEKEVIKNTLSLATLQPDEFAFRMMKGPGYLAVVAGEAIHLVKCIPVDVSIRKTKNCYEELPVMIRNASRFLTPKSRILTQAANERECSHELPILYRIEDTWIQLTPEPHVRHLPPQQLKPMTKLSWSYLTPGPLASSGIYSDADIKRLREHIMFPAEKPAILNSVARGLHGYSLPDAFSIDNLINEDTIDRIAKSAAARMWEGFITFGSATAGVFGIFVVIRVTKLIVDTLIHGYALHSAYGCSMHLLGAIWSSLTHLLLHLAHPPQNRKSTNNTAAPKPKDSKTNVESRDTNAVNSPSPTAPILTYSNLQSRLDEIDQIPTTGFVQNKGDGVTSRLI